MWWLILGIPAYLACGLVFTAGTIWLGGWPNLSRAAGHYHDRHGFSDNEQKFMGVVFTLGWPVGFVFIVLLLSVMGMGKLSGLFVERVAKERIVYFSAARQITAGEAQEKEQRQTFFQKALLEVEELLR